MQDITKLIHGGTSRGAYHGASSVPIFQCSTFHQADPLHLGDFDYSRSANPTRQALEECIADLEEGAVGLAFASGIAAISSTLLLFRPGDHLVVCEDVYGGTFRALTSLFARWGLQVSFADATQPELFEKAIQPNTKAIFVETPSNPLLRITDLRAMVKIAQKHQILSIIDNTFAGPIFQKPLALGFDISLHSATKFLGGHSDVVAGLAAIRDPQLGKQLRVIQNAFGAVLGPQDSWLVHRGIKTLAVRMEAQAHSSLLVAEWLLQQSQVQAVHYPGLPAHSGYALHKSQCSSAGAVLAFDLGSQEKAEAFLRKVQLPLVGVSLGGVESILSYPTTMSHAAMPAPERLARGIGPGLVRLSVGLESPQDLIADFTQALSGL